jgi:hypothetical protein
MGAIEWRSAVQEAPPRLVYNADDGSLMIETSGPAITIDSLVGEVLFERLTAEGDLARPFWLSRQEIKVLAGMIGYILKQIDGGQLRIQPESEAALRELHPRAEALAAASESDDG